MEGNVFADLMYLVKEEQEVDNKRESRKCLVMLTVSHNSQTKALFF